MQKYSMLVAGLFLGACAANPSDSLTSGEPVAATADSETVDRAVTLQGGGDRVICSSEPVVGTRLPNRRTCRTVAEWERISEASKEEVDRVQRAPLPNTAQDGN